MILPPLFAYFTEIQRCHPDIVLAIWANFAQVDVASAVVGVASSSKAGVLLSPQMQEMALHHHQLQLHHQHPDGSRYERAHSHPLINCSPSILARPMSALTQLHRQVSRGSLPHGSPSPPGSKSATPSPSSSNQEEECDPHLKVLTWRRFSSLW